MKKSIAWVKWVAIGFFAVMAVLTFFSGTIRNLTLPQITTQPVTSGTITPVVAGSGMTEAAESTEILASRAGSVTDLLVQPGDRVKAGDVLMRVDYPDDGTMAAKQAELDRQQKALAEARLTATMSTDSSAWTQYQMMKNNLEDAEQRQARCQEYLGKRKSLDSQLSAAKEELSSAQSAYHAGVDTAAQEAEAAHQALDAARRQQENAQANASYYQENPESEEYLTAKAALDEANAAVLDGQNRCYAADTALEALQAQYQPSVGAAQQKVDELTGQITSLEIEYAGCTDEKACENAVLSAKGALSSAWTQYQMMKSNLEDAEQRQARCQEYLGKRKSLDSQLSAAKEELSSAQSAYHAGVDAAAQEAEAAHQALDAARRHQENAQANASYYQENPESEEYLTAKAALDEANAAVLDGQNRCYAADTALEALHAQYQPSVGAARQKVDELTGQITSLEIEYAGCTDEKACENAVLSAKGALSSYYESQKNAKVQDELEAARLAEMESQIEELEQEIAELEAKLGAAELRASCDGIVETIYEAEEFENGEKLFTLQSSDAYTLSCSVPIADAALLRIGSEARITNQSAGGVQIVLSAMEPDETDPTNMKRLIFTVTGDNATANQYFSIAVALESSKHDLVVPNAAVWQDAKGVFVYVVETKTTPLGSRSKVKRVDVEVLRRDDRYTAVSGDLSRENFVVVLSSAPLEDGQAVRFGD